jgi:hypothetical protein
MLKIYGQEVKPHPALPDRAVLLLRARLVLEEALEFVDACGCAAVISDSKVGTIHDRIEVVDIGTEPNLIEYADACGDQLVVTYGALNAAGIQVEPLWAEILRSNKSKRWPHCGVCDKELKVIDGKFFHHADGPDNGHFILAEDVTWRVHKRADGKVLKPPTYSPPDIQTVLVKQIPHLMEK